ncbi:MAG: hypothetical protein QM758_05565 [Armatimonas sp.]
MDLPFIKTFSLLLILACFPVAHGQVMPPWPPKPSPNQRVVEDGSYSGAGWTIYKNNNDRGTYVPTSLGHINPKGKWLGLYESGKGKYILKPCVVETSSRKLEPDWPPRVSVTLSPKLNGQLPLFAVKAGLPAGPVSTVFCESYSIKPSTYMINGELRENDLPFTVWLNHRKYFVYSDEVGAKYKNGEKIFNGRKVLVLKYRGRKQILESWRRADCKELLWMGDLDRDGKLDLYVGVSGHGGYFERFLFLSSWAEPNEIVGCVDGFADSSP